MMNRFTHGTSIAESCQALYSNAPINVFPRGRRACHRGCFDNLFCPQSRDFDGQWSPASGKFDMSATLVFEEVEKSRGTGVQILFIVVFKKNNYCLVMFTVVELDEQISNKILFILFLNGSLEQLLLDNVRCC